MWNPPRWGLAYRGELGHTSVVKTAGRAQVGDDPRTRDLVARSILENGPSTAVVLAERLGLTPAGIRRHLEALVGDGILEARQSRANLTRGRGRPSKVFMMSDSGREKFEHSYDDLAVAALRFLAAQTGEQSLNAFANARAEEMERSLSQAMQGTTADRPEALAIALSAEGYAGSIMHRDHGEELCQHHCPIAHVAAEFPQLCEAETEALSRLLGTHVQRLATIAHGDGVCTTYIPKLWTLTSTPTGGK
ncbi:MAG TPA: metalloregulator ArsR/SmtB family transcription factor [Candidatus Nanopelagicaceae bacterium]